MNLKTLCVMLPATAAARQLDVVIAALRLKAEDDVTVEQQLAAVTWEVLIRAGGLDPHEVRTLVTRCLESWLFSSLVDLEAAFVNVADGRYAVWTGRKAWLDLRLVSELPELPKPPVLLLTLNLAAAWRRFQEKRDAGNRAPGSPS